MEGMGRVNPGELKLAAEPVATGVPAQELSVNSSTVVPLEADPLRMNVEAEELVGEVGVVPEITTTAKGVHVEVLEGVGEGVVVGVAEAVAVPVGVPDGVAVSVSFGVNVGVSVAESVEV